MLTFSQVAREGDVIRGEDFPPRPDVGACYMQGIVLKANHVVHGVSGFRILVTERLLDGQRYIDNVGQVGFIPHQCTFEWESRVRKLARSA